MRSVKITCDGCGVEKKDVNHWFQVDTSDLRFSVYTWRDQGGDDSTVHLCGESCAQKAFQKWMESVKG
jgi:hypothetical protein